MQKFRKYLYRILAVIAALCLLLFLFVFTYVSLNKRKIINQVTAEISKKINGKVSIGNVELSFFRHFPKVSVLLNDVFITDSLFAQHNHPLLQAKEVYAQINIRKLLNKQSPLSGLRINDAAINIFTDTSGYSNNYMFQQKADNQFANNPNTSKNELSNIIFNNVRIIIDDRKKEKLHDLQVNKLELDMEDRNAHYFIFTANTNILVNRLAFNLARGSFLQEKKFKGKFEIKYDKVARQLQMDSIDINLDGHPFNLTAKFDLTTEDPQFMMRLHTINILYDKVKSLLPQRIARSLSIVNINNPLSADASINGPLKGGDPLINIQWNVNETLIKTPFMDFDEAKFSGLFTNEVVPGMPRKDANSRILVNNFSASWHGLPVHADSILIDNLDSTTLSCDLRSNFPLAALNDIIGTNTLQLTAGSAEINMTYKGPITRNNNTNSMLNGSITFNNGTLVYVPRSVEMQQVKGSLIFKNSDVIIRDLKTVVNRNSFVMQGEAKNLLTLMQTGPGNINIDWSIYTPLLDLNSFIYLLNKRKKKTSSNTSKKIIANTAATIDNILEDGKLHVKLGADKLLYKNFAAEKVSAAISFLSDSYVINNASMNHAGGKLDLKGSLVTDPTVNRAKLTMNLNNVDVRRLFRAFNNFGQDGITDQSLQGTLTAKLSAALNLNGSGRVNPASLISVVDFSLKNGELNNYEPIKKLQRVIFKKRDFENIRFAELKNRFDISNQEIRINRMEIQSSVLSMFVEGLYSMKGNTDISIQVPLNNLKKRDSTYNPENIGLLKKAGKSLFIRGKPGDDGSIKFKIDLFNKYNKEKNGSN